MDISKTAKDYLQDRPFKVVYYMRTNEGDIQEYYSEDYPDFIPKREDLVTFGNTTMVVSNTIYSPIDNKLEILIEDYKKYFNKYKDQVMKKKNSYMRTIWKLEMVL